MLLGGVGVTVGATLAACGRSRPTTASHRPTSSSPVSPYVGDLRVVALAAATENLAVAAYARARTRATAGGYGTVPLAVATYLAAAQAQHLDHADAWNGLLSKAGAPPVVGTPLRSAPSFLRSLTTATTVGNLTTAASALEAALAQTCLAAVGSVADVAVLGLAAGIAPVEAQHAAVLNFFLATAPTPQSFLPTGSAIVSSDLTL
ncbi:MAG TPA: ferritin-like domain-containing protein [Mycobacteriales bacterium]